MGVKDLWKILECVGHPVTLESLEGLLLAVDVSIWLNQAVKGARDHRGEMLKGAHLAVLFSRICKLLHYRIKPVFVFDGPPPTLKLQTLRSRNQWRRATSQKLLKNADKRVSKYIQASILSQMTGEEGPQTLVHPAKPTSDDLFWLPPLPDQSADHGLQDDTRPASSCGNDVGDHNDTDLATDLYHHELANLDVHSEQFAALPPETQHDLLLEKQRYEKYTYHHPSTLPQVADDFSQYQLARLVKRSRVSERLECVRRVLRSGEAAVAVGDMSKVHHVETNRVVSSDHTRYILVRGSGLESSLTNSDSASDGCRGEPLEPDHDRDVGGDLRDSIMDHARHDVCREGEADSLERTLSLIAPTPPADCNSNCSPPPVTVDVVSLVSNTTNPSIPCSPASSKMADSLPLATSTVCSTLPSTAAVGTVAVVHTAWSTGGSIREAVEGVARPLDRPSVALTTDSGIRDACGRDGEEARGSQLGRSGEEDIFGSSDGAPTLKGTGHEFKKLLDRAGPTTPPFGASLKSAVDNSPQFISSSEQEELEDEGAVVVKNSVSRQRGLVWLIQSLILLDVDDRVCTEGISHGATAEVACKEMESLLEMPVGVAREQVRREVEVLEEERNRQRRDEAAVESHMYQDVRELLSLFGIPYVLSPGEAEAQCAALELLDLTNGTITDDNDVFLFGGSTVYRHFFSQDHHPEKYTMDEIKGQIGLSREKLILLAYLLGSDYTDGLEGVGTVLAMEFLDEFKLDGFLSLQTFKEWHSNIPLGVNQTAPLKRKLSQLVLPHGFPNEAVREAYLNPRVDQSKEAFNWSKPDLDLIRKFAASHIGWPSAKVDGILLPVIKKMNAPESQQKMTRFVVSLHPSPGKKMAAMSKRMRKAVDKLRTSEACTAADNFKRLSSSGSDSDEGGSCCTSQAKRPRGAKGKDKAVSRVRGHQSSVNQRSPGQGLESADSDMEFDTLAREIIRREQGVAGAGGCLTEVPCFSQGRDTGGKKGRGTKGRRRGKAKKGQNPL
ncbi:hypothetical protein EMCRGX_G008482 [Ephydatia muelleri]